MSAHIGVQWMLSSILASVLISLAAMSIEHVLTLRRGIALRWVWVAGLLLSLGVSARWLKSSDALAADTTNARATSASIGPVSGEIPSSNPSTDVAQNSSAQPLTESPSLAARASNRLQELSKFAQVSERAERVIQFAWAGLTLVLVLMLAVSQARLMYERRSWSRARVEDVDLLVSNGFGPAIVGILRPTIVVPPWVLALDSAHQRAILAHEDEHRRARDLWLLLGALLAIALVPWNVGMWIMWRRLGRAIELDCDERVVRRGVSNAEYATVLLNAWLYTRGQFPWVASPAFAEHVSGLGRRVEHLMRPKPRRWIMKTVSGAFACAALLGAAMLVPTPQQAQSTATAVAPRNNSASAATARPPKSATVLTTSTAATSVMATATGRQMVKRPALDTGLQIAIRPALDTAVLLPTRAARDNRRVLIATPLDSVGTALATMIGMKLVPDERERPWRVVPPSMYVSQLRAAGFTTSHDLLVDSDLRAAAGLLRANVLVALSITRIENGLLVEARVGQGFRFNLYKLSDSRGDLESVSNQIVRALQSDSTYRNLRGR